MDSTIHKPIKFKKVLGVPKKNPGEVRIIGENICRVLPSVSTVHTNLWVGNMGSHSVHYNNPREIAHRVYYRDITNVPQEVR